MQNSTFRCEFLRKERRGNQPHFLKFFLTTLKKSRSVFYPMIHYRSESDNDDDDDESAGRYVRAPPEDPNESNTSVDYEDSQVNDDLNSDRSQTEGSEENYVMTNQFPAQESEGRGGHAQQSAREIKVEAPSPRLYKIRQQRPSVSPVSSPPRPKKKKNDALKWGKFIKPEPYPKDTAQERKLEAWIDWKQQFKIALELAGEMSQRTQANFLFMSVGNEVRQIISAYSMMPEKNSKPSDYKHFDELLTSLDGYFRDTSDINVHLNTFSAMKQELKESAREFRVRLTRQAELCQLRGADEIICNRYVQGMRDRDLANRAFIDN